MNFGIETDVTQVSSFTSYQGYRDVDATPINGRTVARPEHTEYVSLKPPVIQRPTVSTPMAFNGPKFYKENIGANVEPLENSPVDIASEQRLALLVQKHEGASTREENARLKILTQRLRRLSPRVTAGDVVALTTMVEQIEEVSTDLDDIRRQFGIA